MRTDTSPADEHRSRHSVIIHFAVFASNPRDVYHHLHVARDDDVCHHPMSVHHVTDSGLQDVRSFDSRWRRVVVVIAT